jgi:hypothetical protein
MYKRVLRALFYARRIFFAGALTCFALNSSLAAEFTKVPTDDGADIIAVTGHLLSGDEKKFIDVALPSQKALVVFQSPGGNLLAGIEIGKAIHLKGFATLVPDNVECASACALAWLGGRIRFLSDKGRVGFHAVYSDQDGQAAVSSAGNAIVGAHLNQLGLPVVAVVYITSAPPDGIQWLTIPDAQRYGIEVQRANLGTTTNEQSSTVHSSAPAEPGHVAFEDKIKSVTYEFISTTNRQMIR